MPHLLEHRSAIQRLPMFPSVTIGGLPWTAGRPCATLGKGAP